MKTFPQETALPQEALTRTHKPTAGKYEQYRQCARWDFGFTCAFCFLHEPDIIEGSEGTGLFSLEHRELQSSAIAKRDDYQNILLACRFCNGARGKQPTVDEHGVTLLDPTQTAWGRHFRMDGFELQVADPADAAARRTWDVYDLGDSRKTRVRRERHRRFTHLQDMLHAFAQHVPKLMEMATSTDDAATRTELIDAAKALERACDNAFADCCRYQAPPADASDVCRCPCSPRQLPAWLERQLLDMRMPRRHRAAGQ